MGWGWDVARALGGAFSFFGDFSLSHALARLSQVTETNFLCSRSMTSSIRVAVSVSSCVMDLLYGSLELYCHRTRSRRGACVGG